MKKVLLGAALAVLFSSPPARAVRMQVGEETFANVNLFLQSWAQVQENGAPNGRDLGTDFYIRRCRLLLSGSLTKNIGFFLNYDLPNLGREGDWQASSYIQDAFISFRIAPQLVVDTGMLAIPITRHFFSSAGAINSLDYYGRLLRFPPGSHKVGRDTGIMARGDLFNKRIHYRLGAFNGITGKGLELQDGQPLLDEDHSQVFSNGSDVPRVAGYLRYHFLDPESDLFAKSINFNRRRVVSLGVGFDFQPQAVVANNEVHDYRALGADFLVDLPVTSDQEFLFQTNLFMYDHGDRVANTGLGMFAELGYRIGRINPVVAYEMYNSYSSEDTDYSVIHGGLNFWLKEAAASLKADVGLVQQGTLDASLATTLQAQLFF